MARMLAAAALLAGVACADPARLLDAAPPQPDREIVDAPLAGRAPLDVLLVIDNSGDMEAVQAQLASAIHWFVDALDTDAPGSDLRIGVVTSDLGTLDVPSGCGPGDDGELQTSGCAGIEDDYLVDRVDRLGDHITNYTGDLARAMSCLVRVGHAGCGFEQHLEAMRTAFLRPGFLRAEADLAILIVGNEDDCSAYSPTLYAPDTGLPLGPRSDFRCFRFGVVCAPDEPDVFGVKSGCRSREDSEYVFPVARYVDFMRGLKSDLSRIVVGSIIGPTAPIEVVAATPEPPSPGLLHSCEGPVATAGPSVRLSEFASFFGHSVIGSACEADEPVLTALGQLAVSSITRRACFTGTVLDTQPDAGLQAHCEVALLIPDQPLAPVPACAPGSATDSCWQIDIDPGACPDGAHHELSLVAATRLPAHTRVHATCDVE